MENEDEKELDRKYIQWMHSLTNKQLLHETLRLSGGDDYDSYCFSKRGAREFGFLIEYLETRLKDAGFLEEDDDKGYLEYYPV